ncbi:MAG TPA: hypothetical protein VFR84_13045 [Candidatus Angelobacter sp.]|nr:hypothetical protein [Candidatus Angelobacter sp.]
MSTSQVLDRTFHLYRNNFVLFAGIALIAPALSLIAALLQLWLLGPAPAPPEAVVDPAVASRIFTEYLMRAGLQMLISLMVYAIGAALATGATTYAVSMVHLGKPATIAESYRKIKPMFWRILRLIITVLLITLGPMLLVEGLAITWAILQIRAIAEGGAPPLSTTLALLVLLLLGLLAGVIWAIYALCRYALAVPACVLENLPVGQSLTRGRFLIRKSLLRVFGVYLLTFLMVLVLTTVLQLPAWISGSIFTKPAAHLGGFALIWLLLAEFLGKTLAGPIVTIAIALLYYDQRVRKEAFDLQVMMEAVGQPSPQPSIAVSAPPTLG